MIKSGKSKDDGGHSLGNWIALRSGKDKGDEREVLLKSGIERLDIQEDFYKSEAEVNNSCSLRECKIEEDYVEKKMKNLPLMGSDFENLEAENDLMNARGMEEKLRAIMEGNDLVLSKELSNKNAVGRSLMEWTDGCEKNENEGNRLEGINSKAVDLEAEISWLIGDLMFRLSDRKEVLAKFREFISSLENVTGNKNIRVIKKVIDALKLANREITEREKVKIGKKNKSRKGSSSSGVRRATSREKSKEPVFKEREFDQILLELCREAYKLDCILYKPGPLEVKLSPPQGTVKEYESALGGIDKKVKKLKEKTDSMFKSEVLNFDGYRRTLLQFKINKLWDK